MKTLIRITTVPLALKALLPGQPSYMKEHGFNVIMISADGPQLKEVIEKEKCPHIIVPMTRSITPVKDLLCLLQLIRIFKKHKPDIVHTHTPKAGLLGMLAAKLSGVKIRIHTIAGLPVMVESGIKKKVLILTERITSWAANHVWPNSKSLLKYMSDLRLANKNKLGIIMNGSTNGINISAYSQESIDPNMLQQIKEKINYPAIENNIKILCVGRMVKDKGIEELITVFRKLRPDYKVHLILLGPFEDKLDPLSSEAKEEILHNPNITHITWSNEVKYYMALSDILVHPSHREGFPNVILQAGSMKLPVVCSDIIGNNDIITNNKTGLLFKPKDGGSFYETIVYAINHKAEMTSFTDRLYQEITELYDQMIIHRAILDSYNRLLLKES